MSKVAHTETIEWISVEDEMPDVDICVLISNTNREPWIGFYDDEIECWRYDNGAKCVVQPTFWANLPKGPE